LKPRASNMAWIASSTAGQPNFDWEFAIIPPNGGERVSVDDARIVRLDVSGDGVRFRDFLVDWDILPHSAAKVLEKMEVLGKKRDIESEDGAHFLCHVRLRFLDSNAQLFRRVTLGEDALRNLAQKEWLVPELTSYIFYARQQLVTSGIVYVGTGRFERDSHNYMLTQFRRDPVKRSRTMAYSAVVLGMVFEMWMA
jgi:hypothetical protein